MRLLHVCDSIIGGTGSYLAELLPLQAARHGAENVKLLMPGQHMGYVEPRLVAAGVELIPFSRRNRPLGIAALFARYARVRRGWTPDIVHAHSLGAGLVTRTLRLRRSPRLVFCPHGWSTDMAVPRPAIWGLTQLERALAARADRIVLISHYEETRALQMGIDPAKLVTVPNGIAADPPPVTPAHWDDPRLRLLFVGRLDRQKGLDVLLDAVRPLGDRVALRVVGAAVLSDPAASREAGGDVEYCGWMDRDGVAAQMAACDALVVPSRWEGFGLVAAEAMRLGKPVIGSAVGGLGEILGEGRYGVALPPGDPVALRAALASLTPERLRELGAAGRERFRAAYTSDRMAAGIDAVYRDILPGAG